MPINRGARARCSILPNIQTSSLTSIAWSRITLIGKSARRKQRVRQACIPSSLSSCPIPCLSHYSCHALHLVVLLKPYNVHCSYDLIPVHLLKLACIPQYYLFGLWSRWRNHWYMHVSTWINGSCMDGWFCEKPSDIYFGLACTSSC